MMTPKERSELIKQKVKEKYDDVHSVVGQQFRPKYGSNNPSVIIYFHITEEDINARFEFSVKYYPDLDNYSIKTLSKSALSKLYARETYLPQALKNFHKKLKNKIKSIKQLTKKLTNENF